jgi:hypothetical protein
MAEITGRFSLDARPARVESAIDRTRRRLDALEKISAILAEFPELVDELGIGTAEPVTFSDPDTVQELNLHRRPVASIGRNGEIRRLDRFGHMTSVGSVSNFQRIRHFFVETGNRWAQAPYIGERLNLTRGTVATVLWTSHRDQFDQASVDGSEKKKQWRLKSDVYEDAKTQIDKATQEPKGGEQS